MKFRYCVSVIENSSLWKFFILKILRKSCVSLGNSSLWKFFILKILQKSCVSLGNSSLWKFFALKNLRFENSSEKLCFFRKFFTLILLIYQILIQSISTRYRVSAWNSSFSEEFFRRLYTGAWYGVSDPDTGYQMLIQSISTWYKVSARNSSFSEEFFEKWRNVNPPFKPLPL